MEDACEDRPYIDTYFNHGNNTLHLVLQNPSNDRFNFYFYFVKMSVELGPNIFIGIKIFSTISIIDEMAQCEITAVRIYSIFGKPIQIDDPSETPYLLMYLEGLRMISTVDTKDWRPTIYSMRVDQ